AVGAILYEMFAGQPPYVGHTIEILHRTVSERPKSIKEAIHDTTKKMKPGEISTRALVQIPPAIEELCMKCLSQDKAGRRASMAELADLIEQTLVARVDRNPKPAAAPAPEPPKAAAAPAPAPEVRPAAPVAAPAPARASSGPSPFRSIAAG